jgi:hypothetical protein
VTNSLVIANAVELLGGGVPSQLPLGQGATYYLSPGWSLGAPAPTVDITGQLMIDGERPFGRRASNRTIVLPITILAPDKTTLAAAREALLMLIDADQWTLTWTRDSGQMPLIFDCFRAQPTVVTYSISHQNAFAGQLSITFEALPYGRSNIQQQVAFPSPLPGTPPAPPSAVVLDGFTTISSGPLWFQSQTCVIGPNTGYWDPSIGGAPDGTSTPLVYTTTFSSPVSIAGLTALTFWAGLGSRYWWNLEHQGKTKVNIAFDLTDTNGNMLSFWVGRKLHVANSTSSPCWTYITTAIPQSSTVFAYGSVASLQITITNRPNETELRYVVAWLDAITAVPPVHAPLPPSVRGTAYTMSGVQGTSHAPISVQAQQGAAPGTPTVITTAGVANYTVPAGTIYLKVEAFGGGGAGSGETGSGVGGGGGGGEYGQEPVFAAVVGASIPYSVGAAGTQGASPVDGQPTYFGPAPGGSQIVIANGGKSALQNSIVGGLGGTGSTNSIHFPGGTGRTASGSVGGGGGSSASAAGAGSTPVGTSTVVLTGSGNWTIPAGVTQVTVTVIGAGGGGGTGGSNNGGGGGGGESATQTFTGLTPGNTIAYACGTGGAPGSSGGNTAGSAGSATTFGPVSSTTLTAHGGAGGPTSSHSVSGGLGGTGSTAPAHYNGGQGGGTSPYAGSGGSSAGTSAVGNNGIATGTAGGAAPVGGGAGGAGTGNNSTNASSGALPGGGGGGTWSSGHTAGTGGNGQITISYPGGAPTNNGAAAPSGGGAGGNGGGSANTAGSAGSAPGGAGGGADSTGTAENGGAGAAGKLIITPYQLPTFKTLILHRPRPEANASLMPFIGVGNGNDSPAGAIEYTVPSLITPVPLNANTSFSSGSVTPWTAQNSATLSWDAATFGGDPSAVFHGTGAIANPGMISENTIAVTAGNIYTAAASLYSVQGFSTTQILIQWLNAASSVISTSASSNVNVVAGVIAGTNASVTATAPAGAVTAAIIVQMTGTPASSVLMYTDNVSLSPTPMPARFGSTYSVVLINSSWNSPTSAHTLTVTVKQYEYPGGPSYTNSQAVAVVTPTGGVTNGIVVVGEITLPWKDIPPDNSTSYFTVTVQSSNTSDRFLDVLLLDTAGETVIINEPSTGYTSYFIDEPDANVLLGRHMGSSSGRSSAISVLDACQALSGGALTVEPGDNILLAYCVEGAPAIGVSYFPRWFIDRAY